MVAVGYPSDLSDAEWSLVAPLLPAAKPGGRPRSQNLRAILNAILYVLRSGCAWRLVPQGLPKWQTIYDYFRRWRQQGVWEHINHELRARVRAIAGRAAQPSAAIADSQSVRTTEQGGPHGYDGAKKLNGRKRHLLVDTTGLVLKAYVHPADVPDRDGARPLLQRARDELPAVRHRWADMAYRGDFVRWVEGELHWSVQIVQHPRRWGWYPEDVEPPPIPASFTVLPRRWVVERTFAWLGRHRRLSKDYERRADTTEAWIYAAMSRLMLRRLARGAAGP